MSKKTHDTGLTLVEVIVALAVLTIVLIPFLNLLIGSSVNIFAAGNKNQALYDAQKELENEIKTSSGQGQTHSLQINFPGVAQMQVDGKIITINENYLRGNNTEVTELKAFIP